MTAYGNRTLLSALRRERHALVLLAALLFSMQWMLPVAFAGTVDSDICFGDGNEDRGHDHSTSCPCLASCHTGFTASKLLASRNGTVLSDPIGAANPLILPDRAHLPPAGLNPHDASGRGPPAFS
jgi:hypothetical protein